MRDLRPLVLVVDDDESIRNSLDWLLTSSGYDVATFASGGEILAQTSTTSAHCLLIDVCLPDMTGLRVRQECSLRGLDVATVFITAYDDVDVGVQAMKGGAEDFLLKPFDDAAVLDAVRRAIARELLSRRERHEATEIAERYQAMTPRQQEVCERVVAGRLNKQIAAELGMCEQTVKVHRSRVMHKMRVASVADLVRTVDRYHRLNEGAMGA